MSLASTIEHSEFEAPVTHETLFDEALYQVIAKSKTEIPPLSQEVLHSLDTLDTYDDVATKEAKYRADEVTDIIGVFAGIKPAAYLDMDHFSSDGSDADFYHTLNGLKLAVMKLPESNLAVVSRHREILDAFYLALAERQGEDADNAQRRVGALLGYPATATEYFIKRLPTVHTPDRLPMVDKSRINSENGKRFSQFILSPENYEEEVRQYAEPLGEAVRIMTPETYKKMTHREQKRKNGSRVLRLVKRFLNKTS